MMRRDIVWHSSVAALASSCNLEKIWQHVTDTYNTHLQLWTEILWEKLPTVQGGFRNLRPSFSSKNVMHRRHGQYLLHFKMPVTFLSNQGRATKP